MSMLVRVHFIIVFSSFDLFTLETIENILIGNNYIGMRSTRSSILFLASTGGCMTIFANSNSERIPNE